MRTRSTLILLLSVVSLMISCKKNESITDVNQTYDSIQSNTSQGTKKVFDEAADNTAVEETAKPLPPADGKYPVLTFNETEHDFGKIKQGDKVEHVFKFKNTGEADLIITDAKASCGCTVPDFPKNTPIKPGTTSSIKVSFDSNRKRGEIAKTVTISCNTANGTELITIKALIDAPKVEQKKQ